MKKRTALPPGTAIHINHRTYHIQKECGRGRQCIVYQAIYYDDLNCTHFVLIKELYPTNLNLQRKNQKLIIPEPLQITFNQLKQQFQKTYTLHTKIQMTPNMMNTSSHVLEYGETNHTLYTITDAMEGVSYAQYHETTLHELLLNTKALCEIIQVYHSNNYLHLDIKPDNIFLISKTNHQLLLLDYDTVQPYPIKNKQSILFCTKEYAAPEVLSKKHLQIGPWSDIYSIAIILFQRLFHRFPTYNEHHEYTQYDFSSMRYDNHTYSLKLYRLLQTFFQKCFTPIISKRFQKIELLLPLLNELIEESDLSKSHLLTSFYYYQSHFIGRETELQQLDTLLKQHKCVFIYGIGGIGKSELMKQYALLNKMKYHSIHLLLYQRSLTDNLLDNSIHISHFNQNEDESNEHYIDRKLTFLQKNMSEHDLILLDNFDCENDPYLIKLLQLPCRFIITSRIDHQDYDFAQIHLKAFESLSQCHTLFELFYPKQFSIKEQKQLETIFKILEYHTMSITLLAKTIRESNISLQTIIDKLDSNQGITHLNQQQIMHRKDNDLKKDNMYIHLKTLFHLQSFTEIEVEILASFSMLGALQIRIDLFCEWLNIQTSDLNHLIKCGWIQKEQQRITLHQLIMDLTYEQYASHPCITLHTNLNKWYQQDTFIQEKQIRNRILQQFIQRSTAIHKPMQDLLHTYLKFNCNPELASKLLLMANCPVELYQAHKTQIHVISHCFKFGAENAQYRNRLLHSFRSITGYLYQHTEPSTLCNELLNHCRLIRDITDYICNDLILLENDQNSDVDALYDYFFLLIERIESLLDTMQSNQIDIYEGLVQLLSDRFTDLYFQSHYPTDDFILRWKEQINYYQEDTNDIDFDLDFDDFSKTYEDFGDEAMMKKDYQKAIHYYQQAILHESNDIFINDKLIQAFQSTKQYDKAYQLCLEKQKRFPPFAHLEEKTLSNLAYHLNLTKQALIHCDNYLTYAKNNWLENQDSNNLGTYIEALMYQHQLYLKLNLDCKAIHICLDLFHNYSFLFTYTDDFYEFYAWYTQSLIDKYQYDDAYYIIIRCIHQNNESDIWYHLLSQMDLSHQALKHLLKAYMLQENFQHDESQSYANEGYKLAYQCQNAILQSFACHVLGEAYGDERKEHYQLQCNYCLLAQYIIKTLEFDYETQCNVWQQVILRLEKLNIYQHLNTAYSSLYKLFEQNQTQPSEMFYWMHHQLYTLHEYDKLQAQTLGKTCIEYLQTHTFTQEDWIQNYQNLADFFLFSKHNELAIQCLLHAIYKIYIMEEPLSVDRITTLPKCPKDFIYDYLQCLQKLLPLVDTCLKSKFLEKINSYKEKDVSFKH